MKKPLLFIFLAFTLLISNNLFAQATYDWTGASSTSWSTPGNWKVGGVVQTTNYPGSSAVGDIVRIGVVAGVISSYPVMGATPANSLASITVDVLGSTSPSLTINSPLTLTGAITYQTASTCAGTLAGTGAITATNLNFTTTSVGGANDVITLASSITTLTLSGNLALTTSVRSAGTKTHDVTLNLTGGTLTVAGVQTTNANAANTSTVAISSGATLKLLNTTPFSGLSATGASTMTFNTAGANVEYGGASQTVYTVPTYANLIFSGSGTKTVGAAMAIGGTFTNGSGITASITTGNFSVATTTNNTGTISKTTTGTAIFTGVVTNNATGTITQNGTAGTMTFSAVPVNTGTINQTNTAQVTFTNGATNNSGGNITEGSSGVMLFSAAVTNNSGGTITEGGSGLMTFNTTLGNTGLVQQTGTGGITFTGIVTNNSGGVVTQNGPSGTMKFSVVPSNSGLINQVDAGPLTFTLGVTNNATGTITQDSAAGGTMLFTTTLANTGLVNQTDVNTGGITFTQAVTNNAAGILTFDGGTATFTAVFTNSGTLNQAGTGTGTVTFSNTFTNAKTVSLSAANGTVAFSVTSVSAFTNNASPATFTATDGLVNFSGGAQTITNSNLTTAVTFSDVTFSGGAVTKILTGAVGSAGFITNGTVTVTTTTALSVSANAPFTNNGTFNGGTTGTIAFGTTFTNGSSAVFNSATGASTTTFSGAVTNSGGTITQSSTALMSFGSTVNNSGTITQAAAGTGGITFSGTVTNQSAGIINQSATSGTVMTFTLTPANTGNINLTAAGGITMSAALTNAGTITKSGTGVLTLNGATTNPGTIIQSSTTGLTFPGTVNNSGTITQAATGTGGITFSGGIVTNQSTGIINQSATSGTVMTFGSNPANSGNINLTAAGGITFSLALTNAGFITKTGTGTLSLTGATGNSGTITQGSTTLLSFPGIVTNTGTITQTNTGQLTFVVGVTNSSGGTITQNTTPGGTMLFTTTLDNSGLLNQTGTNTGVITFTQAVTNNAIGTLTFGGSGTATFSAAFANSGTVTQSGSTIVFPLVSASAFTNNAAPATFTATGGSVTFSGAGAQSITNSNLTTPVTFNNLNISTSGTKTLVGAGLFSIASSGVITLSNTSTTTVFDPGLALLTLQSTVAGSASIATLPANTSIIATSTVTVQRFLTGAAINYRGYRLLSSAINSSGAYTLAYLSGTGSANTGSGGVGGGFTSVGNPSIYLYRDDKVPNNASFSAGNYRAITAISPSLTTIDGAATLYSGNGFLYFYRGNPGTNPSTVPSSLVFSVLGNLNLGAITVKPWFTGLSTLSYSLTSGTTAVEGFNLVGNPYPSSINWDTYSTTTSTAGIYAPNVGNTIYTLNPSNKGYASYVAGTGGNGASTNGGSNIIASGQGFFVVAGSGSSPSLTFNEIAKVSAQPATLLLNASATLINPHLRLKLVKDSINNDDIYVGFRANATTKYVFNEDALYKVGSGVVSLSSMSGDNQSLAINFQPFPKTSQIIPLNVGVPAAGGLYQLNLSEANDIPAIYDVWLMDKFKNDSLDIKHNPTYSFNTTSDTATYGANRFKLVIRLNAALNVHLLSFTGVQDTKQIKLTWTAENEGSYTTYVLQRSTDGGHTFTTLDSLTSAGLGTYNDLDPNPVTGINLYRLKQVDVTGSVSYSSVLSFTYTPPLPTPDNNAVNVYPNPVKYILGVVIKPKGDKRANYKITITNNMGMIIKTATTTLPIWLDDVVNLLPGTYFVNVTNNKDNSFIGRATFIKL